MTKDTTHEAVKAAIQPQISEGIGAILRKFCESEEAYRARNLLHQMPDSDWNILTGMLAEECASAAISALTAERDALQSEVTQTLACNRGLVRLNEATQARAEKAEAERDALRAGSVLRLSIERKLGMYGAAYDGPNDARAYTYKLQPGNGPAWRIGKAALQASKDPWGDHIDIGLALLRRLEERGFGIFELKEGEANNSMPPDETAD